MFPMRGKKRKNAGLVEGSERETGAGSVGLEGESGEEIIATGDAIVIAGAIERGLMAIADALRGEAEDEGEPEQYMDGTPVK